MSKKRSETPEQHCWNVKAMYASIEDWKKEYNYWQDEKSAPQWYEISSLKGHLEKSPEAFQKVLEASIKPSRNIEKLYVYAHLKHDEDLAEDTYKSAYNRALTLLYRYQEELSWIEPEILSLPKDLIDRYMSSESLKSYRFHIQKIMRLKPHTLPPREEYLIALAGNALETPHKTFSAINDTDFKFGEVLDNNNKSQLLTHASYNTFIRSRDRVLRKNGFKKLHNKFKDYENTLCETLQGQVNAHIFNARARNYSSSLEAAIYPKNVDADVYKSLIKTVKSRLSSLHNYMSLRKKMLGVEELHLYDIYVPLIEKIDITMSYEDAVDTVLQSIKPLGQQYHDDMSKGLREQGWVDRYENTNKRSGAYSSGCYDSHPYILLNYKETLNDIFTLAHEAGHSMHSLLSRRHQPYHYADYPIFVAEVASTFNEELLSRYLLEHCTDKKERQYLINQRIEDIRATLFRQTMFAEFELFIHEMVEKGIPLTPTMLEEKYYSLNVEYFGPDIIVDEDIAVEWARIPHFYYNFYVYQYATGISAALSLAERVTSGGIKERDDYLNFLSSGCSQYPLDLLKSAGVDMTTSAPIEDTLDRFDKLIENLL